jgi:hypothetical protein
MALTQREIREHALTFAHEWADASRERAESQTFWNEFFTIFGITRRRVASFEEPVPRPGRAPGSIDLLWKGKLLVEHKSRGENLDTAYRQALDYFPGLREVDLPKYILVSDFATFRLYDLDEGASEEFRLADLPARIELFGFISGYQKRTYRDEDPVNIKAAEKMGELHDALLASGYSGHNLEVFLVRLVYCLFADNTAIFQTKDQFRFLLENNTRDDGADTGALIATVFQTLNQPSEQRQTTLDDDLQTLPYVNGLLFAESLPIPTFNRAMRRILLECCAFDWSKVSPAIFGSLFQSVMDTRRRRRLGGHYTAERNILKIVRGLFLDDLNAEFERVRNDRRRLREFHEKISSFRFFDPACGCGNFLIITYRELRRLEIQILKRLREISGNEQLVTDVALISTIDVDSMHGIEIEEFPARIAEVALWLTDHQMNMELSTEFGQTFIRLPLRRSAHIHITNALREDWRTLLPAELFGTQSDRLFVLGNPPFIGKQNRTVEQNKDMKNVFRGLKGHGVLDYVTCWYARAAEYFTGTQVKVAFVSTSSITQGEQVPILWQYLLSRGIYLHFAHRTFEWSSEARGRAHVYCVIIGFGLFDVTQKKLYDYETPDAEPMEARVGHINPYLVDTDDILVRSRRSPLGDVPRIVFGSMANDHGHLLLDDNERADLVAREPGAAKYIRRIYGSDEFLYNIPRWCLWLVDAQPQDLRQLPLVIQRVDAVAAYRRRSKRLATRKLAEVPTLFGERRQPSTEYLIIPKTSSEVRKYVPMGFMPPEIIASDLCLMVPGATRYHFGVVSSEMHMAWLRQIGGRLEGRYRYSNNIVYNNFPWPQTCTAAQQQRVAERAENILIVRATYHDATLADLYDRNTMPRDLLDAHRDLDAAVDVCYRATPFTNELERLVFLLNLYRRLSQPLLPTERAPRGRRRN